VAPFSLDDMVETEKDSNLHLKRQLGLAALVMMGVGASIGSGIFVLVVSQISNDFITLPG